MKLIINKTTHQVIAKTTDENYQVFDENHEVIDAPIGHELVDDITGLFWDGEELYQGEVDIDGELTKLRIENAKQWRDSELDSTDWIVPITDHPKHAAFLKYRAALRNWTKTKKFPNSKPVLD